MATSSIEYATDPSTPKNVAVVSVDNAVDTPSEDVNAADYRANFLSGFTAAEEKKLIRKIDYRLLLLAGICYMIKQIDVTNAASVKVLSPGQPTNIMVQLGMSSDDYNWVQSIYYISYIVFEMPSGLLLQRMGPRHYQTRIMFAWGLVLACHAAVTNRAGLLTARFFLGLAEAGLLPGLLTQCAGWYRSDEMGKPIMWLFAIFSAASIVGSLLIYGISFLDGRNGLSSWQWVFLIEGVLTIAFSGVLYFLYPDYPGSPRTAKWLTPREQEFMELRLATNAPLARDPMFDGKESRKVLKDPRLWAFMFFQTIMNTGHFGLTWFLPTIITNLGFVSPPRNILLLIPPAVAAVIGVVSVAFVLKRAWFPRPQFTLTVVLIEVAVFGIFIGTRDKGAIYAAGVLGTLTSNTFAVPFWAWRSSSIKGATGAIFAFGLQSGMGQLGGVIGPQLFRTQYAADGYKVPYSVCTACIAGGFFGGLLCWYLTHGLEKDVRRVRLEKIRAGKENRLYTGPDVSYDVEK